MKNQGIKLFFGLMIFLFSLALAYFTANYVSTNSGFDYWGTIAVFAGVYVLVGVLIAAVYSISLGFLFSADILIVHLLFQYYGQWADTLKVIVVGAILVILYMVAAVRLEDSQEMIGAEAAELR